VLFLFTSQIWLVFGQASCSRLTHVNNNMEDCS